MAPSKKRGRRNADLDTIPDDVLLTPAPFVAPQSATAMVPYSAMPLAQPRASGVRRAASAVRRTAGQAARKVANADKPEFAVMSREHLLDVAAGAAGAGATALVAWKFIDDIGPTPLAIGSTALGALGALALKGKWQGAAEGVMHAGVALTSVLGLTAAALKKAEKAKKEAQQKEAAAQVAAGKRNAGAGYDDADLVQAMERAERRLAGVLASEGNRNAYGDDFEEEYAWGV